MSNDKETIGRVVRLPPLYSSSIQFTTMSHLFPFEFACVSFVAFFQLSAFKTPPITTSLLVVTVRHKVNNNSTAWTK